MGDSNLYNNSRNLTDQCVKLYAQKKATLKRVALSQKYILGYNDFISSSIMSSILSLSAGLLVSRTLDCRMFLMPFPN